MNTASIEKVLVVSAKNIPLGSLPRQIVREQKLNYRASYIYIYSVARQKLLV